VYPDEHEQLNWPFGNTPHEPPFWHGWLLQTVTSVQLGGIPK